MSQQFPKTGLTNNARSPGSIANAQHHDPSRAERDMGGSAGTPLAFFNDTVEHAIHPNAILRVFNTTAAVEFLYIGQEPAPVTVDATNGFAVVPEFFENFYCGVSDDPQKSIVVKASSAAIQIALMKP